MRASNHLVVVACLLSLIVAVGVVVLGTRHTRTSYYCERCGQRRVHEQHDIFGFVYQNADKITDTEYSRLYTFAISGSCPHSWHFIGSRSSEPWLHGVEIGDGRYTTAIPGHDFLLQRLRPFDRAHVAGILAALPLGGRQSKSQLDREDAILEALDNLNPNATAADRVRWWAKYEGLWSPSHRPTLSSTTRAGVRHHP